MKHTREQKRAALLAQVQALIEEFLDWEEQAERPNLTQIEELDLSGTRITNACLDQLAGLPQLWSVDLTRTQVTHAGIVERYGPKGPPFVVAY